MFPLTDLSSSRIFNNLIKFRPNVLVNLNEMVGESGRLNVGCDRKLDMVFASYFYYTDGYLMIASIFRSIICDHLFLNGNKRTAVLWLLTFCELAKVRLAINDDELYDFVLDVVATSGNFMTIEMVAQHLFSPELPRLTLIHGIVPY